MTWPSLLLAPAPPPLTEVTWESARDWAIGAPLNIVVILLLALISRWLLHRAITNVVQRATERSETHRPESADADQRSITVAQAATRRRQRALTMGSLLRSVVTFVLATIVVLTILTEIGVSVAPLLASAGVGGVALGFGAQSLVKDFLSGIFMIVEDQYGVGDVIDTGEATGEVEEVTLRVTRLRDASGVVWYIRNGEIIRIGNKSQGWAMATIDFPVAYDEDPSRVGAIIKQETAALYGDPEWGAKLLEEPTLAGVESVSGGTMTLRVFAKCRPGEQFAVPRELRERVKVAFNTAGVRGPAVFPTGGKA